jgi:NCAIR mutase (PurE)-related protein
MTPEELRDLLEGVASGRVSVPNAARRLAHGPLRQDNLVFATLDHHRGLRQGLAEVVYGEGKTEEEVLEIADRLAATGGPVLLTRLDAEKEEALSARFPEGRPNRRARTFLVNPLAEAGPESGRSYVAIVSGGTADLPAAEEAAEVCIAMDVALLRIYDVGVAGLHRVLSRVEELQRATSVVVVAGMEGALPSVVGGLVGAPLFAVPTSVGYGASFQGLAALLAMLNSCAPGVTVSNIDNGFSAGIAAARVVKAVTSAASGSPEGPVGTQ